MDVVTRRELDEASLVSRFLGQEDCRRISSARAVDSLLVNKFYKGWRLYNRSVGCEVRKGEQRFRSFSLILEVGRECHKTDF